MLLDVPERAGIGGLWAAVKNSTDGGQNNKIYAQRVARRGQSAGCPTTWAGVCVGAGLSPEILGLGWASGVLAGAVLPHIQLDMANCGQQ